MSSEECDGEERDMKNLKYFSLAMVALLIFFQACKDDEPTSDTGGEETTVSTHPGSYQTNEDTVLNGLLSATSNATLEYRMVTEPTKGKVVVNKESGAFEYTPNLDVSGPDSFRFEAVAGSKSSQNDVTIEILRNPSN